MACFKGRDCVPWNKDDVEEVIMEILGEEGRIWYITKDGDVGHHANEMGSYDMIEIPRGQIPAECSGATAASSRGIFRNFVNNM